MLKRNPILVNLAFMFIVLLSQHANAQTYAALTGKTYNAWKEPYSYNLSKVCPDIKKRINDPHVRDSLTIEFTMAVTGSYQLNSEKFISKTYQEKFNKILTAHKKMAAKSAHPNNIDPKSYMQSFDFYGYCLCINDVSQFIPNETAYNVIPLSDMQNIEDSQKMKCLVDNSRL